MDEKAQIPTFWDAIYADDADPPQRVSLSDGGCEQERGLVSHQ